jgi:hypothetical protein
MDKFTAVNSHKCASTIPSTQNILFYKSLMIHFSNKCLPISQRSSLTNFMQKLSNITLFNVIFPSAVYVLQHCGTEYAARCGFSVLPFMKPLANFVWNKLKHAWWAYKLVTVATLNKVLSGSEVSLRVTNERRMHHASCWSLLNLFLPKLSHLEVSLKFDYCWGVSL